MPKPAATRKTCALAYLDLRHSDRQRGFSLVELAMVLFIISLVVGGLLVPMATQLEARNRNEAQAKLAEIREALIGFALVNGRLPFCTSESDPASPDYGIEGDDLTCDPASPWTEDNILPWKTLGLANGLDPWGRPRVNPGDSWAGHWRYRVHGNYSTIFALSTDPFTPTERLCIEDSNGDLLVSASETPIAIVYSTGANEAADGENATYESTSASTDCIASTPVLYQGGTPTTDFDDVVSWLTRPLLFSRMVTAGALP